jgi:hypothetical protein
MGGETAVPYDRLQPWRYDDGPSEPEQLRIYGIKERCGMERSSLYFMLMWRFGIRSPVYKQLGIELGTLV